MSKSKPPQHLLDKSASLLRHASHSDFKELLLPSMQKTMLRSPENAMRSERPTQQQQQQHTLEAGDLLLCVCVFSLSLQPCPACCQPSLWTSANTPWTSGRPSQVSLSETLLRAKPSLGFIYLFLFFLIIFLLGRQISIACIHCKLGHSRTYREPNRTELGSEPLQNISVSHRKEQ